MKSNPFATRFVAPGRIRWISSREEAVERLASQFINQQKRRGAIVGSHGTGKSTLVEHLLPYLGEVCYRDSADGSCGLPNSETAKAAGLAAIPGQLISPEASAGGSPKNALPPDRTAADSMWQPVRPQLRSCLSQQPVAGNLIVIQLRRASQPPLRQVRRSLSFWQPVQILILDGFEQLSSLGRAWVMLQTRWKKMGLLVTTHGRVGLPTLCHTSVTPTRARLIINEVLGQNRLDDHFSEFQAEFVNDDRLEAMLSRHRGNMREVLMELYDEARRSGTMLSDQDLDRQQIIKV